MSQSLFAAFGLLVAAVPIVAIALVLFFVLRKPSGPVHVTVPHGPPSWNAQLSAPGAMLLQGGYGRIDVTGGMLHFVAADPGQPGWSVPTSQVRAGMNSALMTQELWLESPVTGRVDLTVSREHINRVMTNDVKHFRERGYAREFLGALHVNGGTVL